VDAISVVPGFPAGPDVATEFLVILKRVGIGGIIEPDKPVLSVGRGLLKPNLVEPFANGVSVRLLFVLRSLSPL